MIAISDNHMSRISEAIKAIYQSKKGLGITQKKIAERMGCSQSFVSEMLSGDKHMNDDAIDGFCDALEIAFADLDLPFTPPSDPPELLKCSEKLKHLYELAHTPAFRNISRSIDDWLEILEKRPASEDRSTVAESPANVVEFRKPVSHDNIDAPQPATLVKIRYFEKIPAGNPTQMEFEEGFWIEVLHSSAKPGWYALKVSGDSMLPEYRDGDIVLMDHNQEPKNGDIVAALIDGSESTLKIFGSANDHVTLTPFNRKKYKPQKYHASQVTIQGVLVELVRRSPKKKK